MMWTFFTVLLMLITTVALSIVPVSTLMLTWTTAHRYTSPISMFTVIMVLVYLWSMLISKQQNQCWLKKKARLVLILPTILGICIPGGTFIYDVWQSRFEVMCSEVGLFEYEPFRSDKLAVPDKKSSYLMQESLLRPDGATTLYPAYALFVQTVYPREGYDDSIDSVRCTTILGACENLQKGDIDLTSVATPGDKQRGLSEKKGKELIMVPLGMEAFVSFANSENPAESLASQQIQDTYRGNITNWKDIGGNNE